MDVDKALQQFHTDGYAIIDNFLNEQEIAAMKDRMHQIVEELDPRQHQTVFSTTDQTRDDYFLNSGDKICFFFEEGALDAAGNLLVDKHLSINKIGHALHCLDPVFRQITLSQRVRDLAQALGLRDAVVCQSMYIFKQPKIGGVVLPHQDSTFLNTDPHRLVGVWIPLEDATKDNGCLWFIPGSHTDGVHNDRYMIRTPQDNGITLTHPPLPYDDNKFVPAEMKAGSLALIHGEVVHKSEPNLSARSRHAYTFHMYDSQGVEYSPLNWLQPTTAGTFTHLLATS